MRKCNVLAKKVFFTSDLHFYHKNIISFCDRPYKDVDEMNEALISNWNAKISNRDTVYILGDVSFKNIEHTRHLLDQLHGEKVLIIGNHDPDDIIDYFDKSHDMLGLNVLDDETGKTTFCHLCHFPLEAWDKSKRGSIHLHGHCHGSLDFKDKNNTKRLDVGMDSHNRTPLSWYEIVEILKNRKNEVD